MLNPYLPYPVRIDDIAIETEDKNLKTKKIDMAEFDHPLNTKVVDDYV
mgnify:CR=1 FL=1